MRKVLKVVIVLTLSYSVALCQQIVEDPHITRLMESFKSYHQSNQVVRGWRIQILATTDRRVMEQTRVQFERLFPEYELHALHQNPFYHLKTGAFMTQQDARPMLRRMQRHYPAAFMVTELIEVSEILKYLE